MPVLDASNATEDFEFSYLFPADQLSDDLHNGTGNATSYSWVTSQGNRVTLSGSFTYPGGIVTGSVTMVTINLSDNASDDIVISSLVGVTAANFLSVHATIWSNLFSGQDIFIAAPTVHSDYAGDRNAAGTVGGDFFYGNFNGGSFHWYGDLSVLAGSGTNSYSGAGDVFIIEGALGDVSTMSGDGSAVQSGDQLTGGDDTFQISTTGSQVSAFGDVEDVFGYAQGGNDTFVLLGTGSAVVVGDFDSIGYVLNNTYGLGYGGDDVIVEQGADISNYMLGDAQFFALGTLSGGSDTINGGGGKDSIFGETSDVLSTVDSASAFMGGNDLLIGGTGNDTIYGDVRDFLNLAALANVTFGSDTIYGGDNDDTIYGDYRTLDAFQSVDAGAVDYIFGEGGVDTIHGNGGGDWIYGGTGGDFLYGDSGSDLIFGEAGEDELWGGADGDFMWGGGDSDTLHGEAGADWLYGEAGIDYLYGEDADDVLIAGSEGDFAWGGGGTDTIFGEDGDDTLRGEGEGDVIFGQQGIDTIYGGPGGDFLFGGTEVDTIHGDEDNDQIHGDNGADFLYGGTGNDLIYGGAQGDTIEGNEDNDIIFGEDGSDVIDGGSGLDWLDGGAQGDTIHGGSEADVIFGDAGIDHIYGDAGDDLLWGEDYGATVDQTTDHFHFGDGWGNDTIYDFTSGMDVVDMTAVTGLTTLGQLTLSTNIDGFAVVTFGTDSITFYGVTEAQLTSNSGDFVLN
ncbi:MAG: calcium-binding protein [Nitratireductor sp.]